MATANRNAGLLRVIDELNLECEGLKGTLDVCRGAAILKADDPGAIPDDAIPDALFAAVQTLESIMGEISVLAKAAMAGADRHGQ